ncbi:hypothetical protein IJJ27_04605 [bacterium]|nr:hypothetical protein [bacterium]
MNEQQLNTACNISQKEMVKIRRQEKILRETSTYLLMEEIDQVCEQAVLDQRATSKQYLTRSEEIQQICNALTDLVLRDLACMTAEQWLELGSYRRSYALSVEEWEASTEFLLRANMAMVRRLGSSKQLQFTVTLRQMDCQPKRLEFIVTPLAGWRSFH